MRFLICVALAATAFGCGPARSSRDAGGSPTDGAMSEPYGHDAGTTAFPPDQVSGTRLRARYWSADDGTRQVDAWSQIFWFDNELGTPCTFLEGTLAAGTFSCEPAVILNVAEQQFVDDACQDPQRVATSDSVGPLPQSSFMQFTRDADCGVRKYAADHGVIYELGARLAVTQLFDAVNGCVPNPLPAGTVAYAVGGKLDPSDRVKAHLERVDTGHRLSTIQLVADDGARQRTGWYDNTLATECQVGVAVDGKPRCLPTSVAPSLSSGIDTFADAACTTRVAVVAPPETPDQPPGAFAKEPGGALDCGLMTSRYERIGKRYTGDLYIGNAASCTKLDAGLILGGAFYLEEVPPEAMDAFEDVVVGTGRLQIKVRKDPQGAVDAFPFGPSLSGRDLDALMDSQTHQLCRFEATSDGLAHCLPALSPQMQGLNCDRKVVVATKPPCGQPEPLNTTVWRGDECTGGFDVSAFGAAIMPNSGRVGDCYVVPTPDVTFYEIGAALPPSTFVAAKLVVE